MWKVTLKDGREVRLRFLTADDKEKLFRMFSSMSEKALEWSGAPYTMDIILRWINNIQNLIPLVAEYHNRIVGYAVIAKSPFPRKKGIADFAVYLHQDFHNVGLGTAMTERLLQLAKNEKMHRIELTVVKENKTAIRLYEKFGFQIEGLSKDAFYGQDGKYHDIVNMGLILPQC
jgi:RimJ/RimL family protein N-acetyltransferase